MKMIDKYNEAEIPTNALERTAQNEAKPIEDCIYPRCEECDKHHGHYCTVPMVVTKQNYRLTQDLLAQMGKRLTELENLVTDEILRSDESHSVKQTDPPNYTWSDYDEILDV